VPIISFHGDRDTTVHPSNADKLLAHYRPAEEPASPIKVRQGQTPGGYAYARAVRLDAEGRAVMEQWTVRGLGHAWSGGSRAGSYTDAKGPDASAEMVRFFRQQKMDDESAV
jgi:poly(3-hydroxybutyrate) depolymerase